MLLGLFGVFNVLGPYEVFEKLWIDCLTDPDDRDMTRGLQDHNLYVLHAANACLAGSRIDI